MTEREEQARSYFARLHEGLEGWVMVGHGIDPYLERPGKVKHRDFHEKAFAWPREADKLVAHVVEASDSHDVYATPGLSDNPIRKMERRKPLPSRHLWVDLDGAAPGDLARLDQLVTAGSFAVASGRGEGHLHGYPALDVPAPPQVISDLNRRLVALVHGDPSPSALNGYLRPPGTYNYKPTVLEPGSRPALVAVSIDTTGAGWSAADLDDLLPAADQRDTETPGAEPEPLPEPLPADVAAILADAAGADLDRSERLFELVVACRQAGLSDGQTITAAGRHRPSAAKYGRRLVDETRRILAKVRPAGSPRDDEQKKDKASQSTLLVRLALEHYTVERTDDGTVFAVPRAGPRLTYPLRGGRTSLRAELAQRYFAGAGTTPSQQALADALLVLEGKGQASEPVELHQRVARVGKALWLDLGDSTGAAVEITAQGWRVTDAVPVLFRRTALTGVLPVPVGGGSIDALWRMLNVAEADRPLLVAYLVSTLFPDIPHPTLGLFGEQGTGKSTATKVLVKITDPSPVPLRKPPRDAESWVTAASGSWVVALDNLSALPDWLSDSLCRASTGDGDVRRKLYTDGELAVFAFLRCVIVNGIDLGALNGDFADRLLHVDLELIGEEHRLDEDDLWSGWDAEHPRLLGALLDLVARMIAVLPSVRLAKKPRMADFAKILAALDELNGTDGTGRYLAKVGMVATDSLTGDPFIVRLGEVLAAVFEGTATELLDRVTPTDERWRPPKGWPANAREVTKRLRRQAPVMRKAGWVADDLGAGHANATRWRITSPEIARNPSSPPSPDSQDGADASNASLASMEYGPSQDAQPCQRCEAPTVRVDDQGEPLCMACGGNWATAVTDGHRFTQPTDRTTHQTKGTSDA